MLVAGTLAFGVSAAVAHDGVVEATRVIDFAYFHRDASGNLDQSIARASSALADLEKDTSAEREQLEGIFYWRRCRSLVRRGEKREKKADKLADYDLARQDCEKSVALEPKSADAHFWFGVAMGRWGEAKGILKAMFLIKPIRREMEATLKIDPNHGGAHHVLGEMLWQIPGFAGGDRKKAVEEFELAVKLSPTHTSNYQPLAEAYLHFGRKDDAIKTLKAVAEVKEPADPAEYAENLADAKKLLAELGEK